MMRIFQLIPEWFIDTKLLGLSMRLWIPIIIVMIAIGGLFSPLFNLQDIHGVASLKLYVDHFYFDSLSGLGGFWASSYCKHWKHRIPLFILIDVICTFALVTLVG